MEEKEDEVKESTLALGKVAEEGTHHITYNRSTSPTSGALGAINWRK